MHACTNLLSNRSSAADPPNFLAIVKRDTNGSVRKAAKMEHLKRLAHPSGQSGGLVTRNSGVECRFMTDSS
tara:strand:+ start:385 stop:597 length:213 start_codon:yes stop_codon:yes gene_type:complete